jgi:quercetin dioxygenase-like cupin family protein
MTRLAADTSWSVVVQPEEAVSYWQPEPSRGYVTVNLTPGNMPLDTFSSGTQTLPPGCHVRDHGHRQNHELIFVCDGEGTATIDDATHVLKPGTTVLFGRHAYHRIDNTGTRDLKLFWVFFPPGLEDWFEAIGRRRVPGEAAPSPFARPADVADIQARMKFVPPKAR